MTYYQSSGTSQQAEYYTDLMSILNADDGLGVTVTQQIVDETDISPPLPRFSFECTDILVKRTDNQMFQRMHSTEPNLLKTMSGMSEPPLSPPLSPLWQNQMLIKTPSNFISKSLPQDLTGLPLMGSYMFDVTFDEEKERPKKSCDFTWSVLLNKLFVQPSKKIAFKLTTSPLPETAEIRAFLKFKDERYKHDVVQRCPTHMKEDPDSSRAHHILQRISRDTTHHKCSTTNHWFISFPANPSCGFTEYLTFGCSNMCRGGINRRAIALVFLLYVKDEVVGQKTIDVHISSCPGRDRLNKEKKAVQQYLPVKPDPQPANGIPFYTKFGECTQYPARDGFPAYEVKKDDADENGTGGSGGWKRSLSSSSSDEDGSKKKKKHTLITCINVTGPGDDTLYEFKVPPIRGRENAKAFLHVASLLQAGDDIKDIMIRRVQEKDPLILRNTGLEYFTPSTPITTKDRQIERVSSKINEGGLQRCKSEPNRVKAKVLTVKCSSDLKHEEVIEENENAGTSSINEGTSSR